VIPQVRRKVDPVRHGSSFLNEDAVDVKTK
jgi:hypothetical protein